MRWAWAAVVVLLWPQLVLLGGIVARREPKKPRQPGQHTESPNTTVANSEGLPGSPKVRSGEGLDSLGTILHSCPGPLPILVR